MSTSELAHVCLREQKWSLTDYHPLFSKMKAFTNYLSEALRDPTPVETPSSSSSSFFSFSSSQPPPSSSSLLSGDESEKEKKSPTNLYAIQLQLSKIMEDMEAHALSLAMTAPQFDLSPTLQGNGIRSILKICDTAFAHFLSELCTKRFFQTNSSLLETWKDAYKWIESFGKVVASIDKLLDDVSPQCMFPDTLRESDLGDLMAMPLEAFYGDLFGFQFERHSNLKDILSGLLVAMSSFSDGYQSGSERSRKFRALVTSPKYILSKDKRAKVVVDQMRKGDISFLKAFWNLPENVTFAGLDVTLRTPSPEVDHVFTIPSEPSQLPHRSNDGRMVIFENSDDFDSVQLRLICFRKRQGQLQAPSTLHTQSCTSPPKYTPQQQTEAQPVYAQQHRSTTSSFFGSGSCTKPDSRLLIHVHGGGFVAQTSKAHLNYLREYAKSLDCPILSIDYTLAPERQYPTQMLQVVQTYFWALSHGPFLGSTLKRVVLTGDSAGGNLALALVIYAINHGIRIPDSVVVVYPAILARPVPSPARYLSALDPMLGTGILLGCLAAYTGGKYLDDDPYLSPLMANQDLLLQFPPISIHVGEMDVLLDDSIEFARRLLFLKKDVAVKVYEGLPHGFLGFCHALQCCSDAALDVIKYLKIALLDSRPFTSRSCPSIPASVPSSSVPLTGPSSSETSPRNAPSSSPSPSTSPASSLASSPDLSPSPSPSPSPSLSQSFSDPSLPGNSSYVF